MSVDDHDSAPAPLLPPDVIELASGLSFASAVDRLDQRLLGLAEQGLVIFARIDHQANAAGVGLALPPTLVVIFGSARAGTPLMVRRPSLALDLPLRILIRESGGGTVVAYHDPARMIEAYGLGESEAVPLQAVAAIARGVAR